MSEYFHVVPWFNSEEWHEVHALAFSSSNQERENALNILTVWKARCPALPSGVESTLVLLQVQLQDTTNSDSVMNDHLYRLAYSSAIMRFVNHMLDSETAKGASLYRAANNLGVPDWIVDLRHDTAHSNNLPSLVLLREACVFSLNWLKKNYWDKYKAVIQDYISGQKEISNNSETTNKIAALVNFCISIGIVLNSGSKIKNLADIPDADLRASMVDDVNDLLGNQVDLSNLKKVSVKALENLVLIQCSKMLKLKDVQVHINKVLLGDTSMILSLELLELYDNQHLKTKNTLPKKYLKCFESIMIFLHSNDLIQDFVFGLISITQESEDEELSLLASLWVSEILKSLQKIKKFRDRIKQPGDLKSKNRLEQLALYHHWFPNERNSFMLDLLKPVPQALTEITIIQQFISTYNPFLSTFISDLLDLVVPPLPQSSYRKICMLTKLISNPHQYPVTSSRIYTVDDLKNDPDIEIVMNEVDCKNLDADVEMEDNEIHNSTWNLATNNNVWKTCPIGLLPWQMHVKSN